MNDRRIPPGSTWRRKFAESGEPDGDWTATEVGRGFVTLAKDAETIQRHVPRFFHLWERVEGEESE